MKLEKYNVQQFKEVISDLMRVYGLRRWDVLGALQGLIWGLHVGSKKLVSNADTCLGLILERRFGSMPLLFNDWRFH